MASTETLIRISICIHRRKEISEEFFHRYWAHEHGPLAAEWLKRCGIVKYVQVSIDKGKLTIPGSNE
jgi:hypothetical protein